MPARRLGVVGNWRRMAVVMGVGTALVIAFPMGVRAPVTPARTPAAAGTSSTAGGPLAGAGAATGASLASVRAGAPASPVGAAAAAARAAHPPQPTTRCLPVTTWCSPGPPLSPPPGQTGIALIGVLAPAVGALGVVVAGRRRAAPLGALAAGVASRVLRPPRALLAAV